ncbi:MAG: amidohydrolase family protein [Acidimicrobiales bacterium]
MARQTRASAAPDVALCGAWIAVSLSPPEVVRADLVIADGRVRCLGAVPDGTPTRDCGGSLIVPGNVCAHHHLYSALSRGMPYALAPPADFTEILQRIWWRLDRALDEESVRASAMRGGLDALLAGTTTIVDHHASPNFIDGSLDVIAEVLGDLGVRSVLCYEVTDRDGPERATAGLAENRRFFGRHRDLARGMVGAHASFTLSDGTLERCAGVAAEAGVGVHIHVAEDDIDERDSLRRDGTRVAMRLRDRGVLNQDALLAHCVKVDDDEARLIGSIGATVVCNPRSNMNNGVGHSPFNLRGGRVTLGTDGIGGDMLAESQAGFFRAKEADRATPPEWPLARLAEGARLAGRCFDEPLLGTLRPGAPADLCVLAYDPPTPISPDNLAGHWVFGLAPGRVRDVYVAGELVVEEGRSTRVDEAAVAADEVGVAARLWGRLEATPAHPYDPRREER